MTLTGKIKLLKTIGLFEKLGWITLCIFLILINIYVIAICLFQLDSDQISTLTNLFVATATFLTCCTAILLYNTWKEQEAYTIELSIIATINDAKNYFLYEFNPTTEDILTNVSRILEYILVNDLNQLDLKTINELDYWIFKHNKKLQKISSDFNEQLLILKKFQNKSKNEKNIQIKLPISEINNLCNHCINFKQDLIIQFKSSKIKDFYNDIHKKPIWSQLDTSSNEIYKIFCSLEVAKSELLRKELSQ